MRENGWWRTLLVLLLAAAVVSGLLYVDRRARVAKAQRDEVLARAAPLEMKRDELIARRDREERTAAESSATLATEQLLFLDLDPLLTSELLPLMQERGVTGVLGLSRGNFPGDAGRLSRQDFDRLLAAGWEYCLVYDGGSDFAAWDRDVCQRLSTAELSKPAAIYFPEDRYDPVWAEQIAAAGFVTAVHHGEGYLPLIAEDAGEELWLPGAHPWNYSGVRDQIRELVNKQGEHCFTLRFAEGREEYRPEAFVNMLDFVQPFRDAGTLEITGFARARELHDPIRNGTAAIQTEWERNREELDRQIRDLDEQILAIYAEWNGENDD